MTFCARRIDLNTFGRTFATIVLGLAVSLASGCITPFFDGDRYEGTRLALATEYNNLMAQRRYRDVISLAEKHIDPEDPYYRDAIYYMYQARLQEIQEVELRAEQLRKVRNRSSLSEVDEKATLPDTIEERPTRDRSEIRRDSGFTEPLIKQPTGEMREKLLSKIPVLNVIDTELDYVIYEIFKNSGIKFIVDPALIQDRKVSVRVTDETVLGFLDYLRQTQNIDYTILNNTLRLHPLNTDFQTHIFRLKHGLSPSALSRDFQSLSDLSFINRANEPGGSSGGGGGGGGGGGQGGGGQGGNTTQGSGEVGKSYLDLILEQLPEIVSWPEGSQGFVDRKNNTFLVRSTPGTLREIEQILHEVDVLPVQISIESRFIEIRNMDDFDFGTNFSLSGITFGSSGGDLGEVTIGDGTGTFFGNALTSMSGSRGTNFLFSGPLDEGEFSATIFVLDRLTTAETLSSPSVTTANNSTATIAVVQNLVFVEEFRVEEGQPVSDNAGGGGIGTTVFQVPSLVATINDENFTGFVLNVTPSVGTDGEHISLTIQPVVREVVDEVVIESSAVLATGNSMTNDDTQTFVSPDITRPILETRFVNTNLTVRDGATVVIGGLTRFVDSSTEDKVPFLGDIPILGRLFRRDTRQKEKRNLLIFVTARILNPEGGLYTDSVREVGDPMTKEMEQE